MLQVFDIHGSRIYQEAVEKGFKEGIAKGVALARLVAEKKSIAEIAAILEVDVELVRRVLAKVDRE
jgi:predicted transposase YdaD